jgi:hypothetical protein
VWFVHVWWTRTFYFSSVWRKVSVLLPVSRHFPPPPPRSKPEQHEHHPQLYDGWPLSLTTYMHVTDITIIQWWSRVEGILYTTWFVQVSYNIVSMYLTEVTRLGRLVVSSGSKLQVKGVKIRTVEMRIMFLETIIWIWGWGVGRGGWGGRRGHKGTEARQQIDRSTIS